MSKLTWKSAVPLASGWYWMKRRDGRAVCVEIVQRGGARYVSSVGSVIGRPREMDALAWAGPIARPVEPTTQQLATVRYLLAGECMHRECGPYWEGDWVYVDRAEIERRAAACLVDPGYRSARHSKRVWIYTSVKRNGRWKTLPREEWKPKEAAVAP